jgi:hypothetical protein
MSSAFVTDLNYDDTGDMPPGYLARRASSYGYR